MNLSELLQAREQKQTSCPIVVLTFDDGYADNLLTARPLLEHYEIPATIFLTAGALGSPREFWWDELERIFLQTMTLPAKLEVTIVGKPCEWELGDSAEYGEDKRVAHESWKASESPPTVRQKLFYSVWNLLKPLAHLEQRRVLDELLSWAEIGSGSRESHRILTIKEAIALGSRELITIGAHTMTHPELVSHSLSVQEREIRESKQTLEELLGRAVSQFAYPYGDYSAQTVRIVREAGYKLACSTVERVVHAGIDPFQVPRMQVLDCDGEEFGRQLSVMFRRW